MGRIFISAGHYFRNSFDRDSGADTIIGTSEAQEMIKTRDLVVSELQSLGLVENQDFFSVPDTLDLSPTIRWINNRSVSGDVALEIHGNAGGGKGAEIFHIYQNNERKQDGQTVLYAYLAKVSPLGIVNRGVKPDIRPYTQHPRLAFCRDVDVPSLLLEICFMDSRSDMNALTTGRLTFARGIADGLIAFRDARGGSIPPTSITIDIQLNGQPFEDKGILINNNSYIPIELVDLLGIDLTQQPSVTKVRRGGVVYVKAVDLQSFGISVGWDNTTRTVILRSTRRVFLTQINQIMGKGRASADQLNDFLTSINSGDFMTRFPDIATLYVQEAELEGVNHDIAFCQMCLETGYLRFGGDVKPDQNNFCGLGAIGGGVQGASFANAQVGVKAHIHHLKAYASTEPIAHPPIASPRFNLVTRGIAPTVEKLSGRWATDLGYGDNILSLVRQLYEDAGI